jgi:hypothetical protein
MKRANYVLELPIRCVARRGKAEVEALFVALAQQRGAARKKRPVLYIGDQIVFDNPSPVRRMLSVGLGLALPRKLSHELQVFAGHLPVYCDFPGFFCEHIHFQLSMPMPISE